MGKQAAAPPGGDGPILAPARQFWLTREGRVKAAQAELQLAQQPALPRSHLATSALAEQVAAELIGQGAGSPLLARIELAGSQVELVSLSGRQAQNALAGKPMAAAELTGRPGRIELSGRQDGAANLAGVVRLVITED